LRTFRTGLILFIAAALLFGTGCRQQEKITTGEMEGNSYVNEYFGLRIDIPQDWNCLSQEDIDEVNKAGWEIIENSNKEFSDKYDLSKLKTVNLFGAYKFPKSYLGEFNPSILSVAENIGLAGLKGKTGADYLQVTIDQINQTGLPYHFGKIATEELGGKKFHVVLASITTQGITVQQKYYCIIMKGYALCIIISYSNDSDGESLESILDTMSITK